MAALRRRYQSGLIFLDSKPFTFIGSLIDELPELAVFLIHQVFSDRSIVRPFRFVNVFFLDIVFKDVLGEIHAIESGYLAAFERDAGQVVATERYRGQEWILH